MDLTRHEWNSNENNGQQLPMIDTKNTNVSSCAYLRYHIRLIWWLLQSRIFYALYFALDCNTVYFVLFVIIWQCLLTELHNKCPQTISALIHICSCGCAWWFGLCFLCVIIIPSSGWVGGVWTKNLDGDRGKVSIFIWTWMKIWNRIYIQPKNELC